VALWQEGKTARRTPQGGHVSIERIFYCDWRECDSHTRTAAEEPGMGFVTITEDACLPRHFCSWDCLLKQAAETSPVEAISAASE